MEKLRTRKVEIRLNEAEINYLDSLAAQFNINRAELCLLYTSPSPRDLSTSRMPSSA